MPASLQPPTRRRISPTVRMDVPAQAEGRKARFAAFLRFSVSGILSFLLDIGLFHLLTQVVFARLELTRVLLFLLGTAPARIASSLFNYALNRNGVFRSAASVSASMVRYYLLAAALLLCSWLLVSGACRLVPAIHPTAAKVVVDLGLFLVSYQLQRRWVFAVQARTSSVGAGNAP